MKALLRFTAIAAMAVLVNGGLYLLVPYIQVLIKRQAVGAHKAPKAVTAELAPPPPEEKRAQKRIIKEIKTESYRPPSVATARPSLPGGGLKIDLSPAGGEGLGLVSGGDRTGGIGAGAGGATGSGLAAMVYEMGQTDTDAKPIGPDLNPDYPARAEREGVSGFVDITFIVTESGTVEQISVLREEPTGYYFAQKAIERVKQMRFKPATLQKMAVRQQFKRRFNFEISQ